MVMTIFVVFAAIYVVFRWQHLRNEWNLARLSTKHMVLLVLVIWLIGLLVAWYAPQDVLARNAIAKIYTDIIGLIFPLARYSSRSAFPQVSMLYNAIVWPLLPVLILLCWRFFVSRKSGLLAKKKSEMKIRHYLFLLFVSAPLFVFLGLVALFFWHGGDTRNVEFGSSRIDLGWYGVLGPMSAALCLVLGVASFKKALTGKF